MSKVELIDFVCPYCKIEVDEDGDVLLGEKDNPMTLDINSDSPKVMFHMECMKKDYKEKNGITN